MSSAEKIVSNPRWEIVGKMPHFSQEKIRQEPMIFSCDREHARRFGGRIMAAFLKHLPVGRWIIDSKVTMLMPGMYPCIPGWHHDDVPRTRSDGQPNYTSASWDSASHVATVVGDASLTEFVSEPITLRVPRVGRTIYREWDKQLRRRPPKSAQISSGDIIYFETEALHRGMPATKRGWRIFIRASINSTRRIRNERRSQVQVYLDDISLGW